MTALVQTNDPVIISVVESLLLAAGIPYQVTDRNMSVIEGLISPIQVRILVPAAHDQEARDLLVEAGLGEWVKT